MASCIIYCALTHGSIASSVNTASVDMEFGMPQLILLLGKYPMSIGRLDAFLLRPTIPSIFAWNWWSQANLLMETNELTGCRVRGGRVSTPSSIVRNKRILQCLRHLGSRIRDLDLHASRWEMPHQYNCPFYGKSPVLREKKLSSTSIRQHVQTIYDCPESNLFGGACAPCTDYIRILPNLFRISSYTFLS